ncbi:MAG: hypothetical protein ACTS73_02125 [Arsenophonus sp. NEOnobi-MAG3]
MPPSMGEGRPIRIVVSKGYFTQRTIHIDIADLEIKVLNVRDRHC